MGAWRSPLLRVVVPGSFPDIQLYAKPVPKGKCGFLRENSQGGELGLYALMDACTKSYTEIHFCMPYKTKKAPPPRSLKNQPKTQSEFTVYRGIVSERT